MKRTLYNITDDMRAIDALLDETGGDVSEPKVLEAIEQWISELDNDLKNKVDGYAAYIQELLSMADARKAEAKRLSDLARSNENAAKRLKERLMYAMIERGIQKVDTPRFVVSVSKNGGKAPLDIQVSGEQLPPRFQKIVIDADKEAIRKAIEAGEEVDGCAIMERGTNLRIR